MANAATLSLAMAAVPEDQRASGEPATGSAVLGTFADLEVGVWEMTIGAMRDIEADELFVVLSGSARVEIRSMALRRSAGTSDDSGWSMTTPTR